MASNNPSPKAVICKGSLSRMSRYIFEEDQLVKVRSESSIKIKSVGKYCGSGWITSEEKYVIPIESSVCLNNSNFGANILTASFSSLILVSEVPGIKEPILPEISRTNTILALSLFTGI